jgi:hypothetical protein
MSGCDGLTFRNVSRSAWTAIKRAAGSYGISGSDAGSASSQGFAFKWHYNEATKTLHIQCLDSPALVPCTEINARLQSEVGRIVVAAAAEDDGTIIA